jgi:protein-disulfide isomerase
MRIAKTIPASISLPSSSLKRFLPLAITAVVLVGALGFALYLRHAIESRGAAAAVSHSGRAKPAELAPQPGAEPPHVRGPQNAPVTLEEFADFQCPACGNFYPVLKSIEAEYGTRVRVIFREFPLTMQHQHATAAAQAAEAAGLHGKFWEMHDLLYENRTTWSRAGDVQQVFAEYAQKLGLNAEQFKRDLTSDAVQSRISLDHQRARSIRVRSTPALYLNGSEVPFSQMKTVEGLRVLIDKALNSSSPQN